MTDQEFYVEAILWLRVTGVCAGLSLGVLIGAAIWRFFGAGPFQNGV